MKLATINAPEAQPILSLAERVAAKRRGEGRSNAMCLHTLHPVQSRNVLGLAISASLNAPIGEARFGVLRM